METCPKCGYCSKCGRRDGGIYYPSHPPYMPPPYMPPMTLPWTGGAEAPWPGPGEPMTPLTWPGPYVTWTSSGTIPDNAITITAIK